MKLTKNKSLSDLKIEARHHNRLVYSISTCWWKLGDPCYRHPNTNLPCDPRGGMLLETDDPVKFIETAEENLNHYGTHGIEAFIAAYHGNVVTDNGLPTSFNTWDKYNELLDKEFPK